MPLLGTFRAGPNLWISDLCNAPIVVSAPEGVWEARVIQRRLGGRYRNTALHLRLSGRRLPPFRTGDPVWHRIDRVDVDSGLVAIIDEHEQLRRQPDPAFVWSGPPIRPDDLWFSQACDRANHRHHANAGLIPFGVVASTAYGDGSYSIYDYMGDGEIVGVVVRLK